MENNINPEDTVSTAKCDIFEFFANHLGLTVIHPGGLKATRKLEETMQIDSNTKVLDIACGKGSTAFYLAEKYGCSVVGIDISEELIQEANETCQKKGLTNKVKFQLGNAMDLPFDDNQFDVAISQGILVFVDDKTKTINEASRVIKNGGKAGWVELSWKKEPDENFLDKVFNVLRAYCLMNARTYEGWKKVFERANAHNLVIIKGKTITGNFFETLNEEGIVNTIKITFNSIFKSEVRNRLKIMGKFVEENSDYFGYGVYVIEKT
ncbi:MAG: class I SAM-dependent methyltransferase [Methanobacterium sp.]|uniref:class I SAM-dependent methyltransferase n=1 Tax=Methanobacterium sp. TaxID=2164 RepID=UPI003D65F4CA|nr:class I SAM-dependent methyltransferase [Methanobacterium sp.]